MAFKVSPFHMEMNGSPFLKDKKVTAKEPKKTYSNEGSEIIYNEDGSVSGKQTIKPASNETAPTQRRGQSKKEVRLSKKLEKAENQEQDAWEKTVDDPSKKSDKKQDRKERKVLKTKQKLDRESKKQSRKSFGIKGSGSDRKGDRQERKDLKSKQKRQAKRREERSKKNDVTKYADKKMKQK